MGGSYYIFIATKTVPKESRAQQVSYFLQITVSEEQLKLSSFAAVTKATPSGPPSKVKNLPLPRPGRGALFTVSSNNFKNHLRFQGGTVSSRRCCGRATYPACIVDNMR